MVRLTMLVLKVWQATIRVETLTLLPKSPRWFALHRKFDVNSFEKFRWLKGFQSICKAGYRIGSKTMLFVFRFLCFLSFYLTFLVFIFYLANQEIWNSCGIDDDMLVINVFSLISFSGSNFSEMEWFEKKKVLNVSSYF